MEEASEECVACEEMHAGRKLTESPIDHAERTFMQGLAVGMSPTKFDLCARHRHEISKLLAELVAQKAMDEGTMTTSKGKRGRDE